MPTIDVITRAALSERGSVSNWQICWSSCGVLVYLLKQNSKDFKDKSYKANSWAEIGNTFKMSDIFVIRDHKETLVFSLFCYSDQEIWSGPFSVRFSVEHQSWWAWSELGYGRHSYHIWQWLGKWMVSNSVIPGVLFSRMWSCCLFVMTTNYASFLKIEKAMQLAHAFSHSLNSWLN